MRSKGSSQVWSDPIYVACGLWGARRGHWSKSRVDEEQVSNWDLALGTDHDTHWVIHYLNETCTEANTQWQTTYYPERTCQLWLHTRHWWLKVHIGVLLQTGQWGDILVFREINHCCGFLNWGWICGYGHCCHWLAIHKRQWPWSTVITWAQYH